MPRKIAVRPHRFGHSIPAAVALSRNHETARIVAGQIARGVRSGLLETDKEGGGAVVAAPGLSAGENGIARIDLTELIGFRIADLGVHSIRKAPEIAGCLLAPTVAFCAVIGRRPIRVYRKGASTPPGRTGTCNQLVQVPRAGQPGKAGGGGRNAVGRTRRLTGPDGVLRRYRKGVDGAVRQPGHVVNGIHRPGVRVRSSRRDRRHGVAGDRVPAVRNRGFEIDHSFGIAGRGIDSGRCARRGIDCRYERIILGNRAFMKHRKVGVVVSFNPVLIALTCRQGVCRYCLNGVGSPRRRVNFRIAGRQGLHPEPVIKVALVAGDGAPGDRGGSRIAGYQKRGFIKERHRPAVLQESIGYERYLGRSIGKGEGIVSIRKFFPGCLVKILIESGVRPGRGHGKEILYRIKRVDDRRIRSRNDKSRRRQ